MKRKRKYDLLKCEELYITRVLMVKSSEIFFDKVEQLTKQYSFGDESFFSSNYYCDNVHFICEKRLGKTYFLQHLTDRNVIMSLHHYMDSWYSFGFCVLCYTTQEE